VEKLNRKIEEIEAGFKIQVEQLKAIKSGFVLLSFAAILYGTLEIIEAYEKNILNGIELATIELGIVCMVLVPVITAPLYYFLNSRIHHKINWALKSSIFNEVLQKYHLSYKIVLSGQLPKQDLLFLDFERKLLDFAYGDDLLHGYTQEGHKFRIAEMHSSNIFKTKFDGIVGVVVYQNQKSCDETLQLLKKKEYPEMEIRNYNNKIYFLRKGKKKHFEYHFKNAKLNKDELNQDYNFFADIVAVMFTTV